ncbi:hypothetical protein KCP75_08730 [Salmonella enterica subsp. enterica]|nr:hypothetical protein KCP75_08730 [Salmonella enterica subsp. enterica]
MCCVMVSIRKSIHSYKSFGGMGMERLTMLRYGVAVPFKFFENVCVSLNGLK